MPHHTLPDAALQQHIAVLGKTGAGKTYRLRGMIERLLNGGMRVCVLDPKGDHWGIRLSVTGKSSGYSVIIFGGERADVPINDRSGGTVGELVATGNRPCVIDLSSLGIGERTRFFMDFAAALFRHNRAPLWLVIDEVHNFAPQAGGTMNPESAKMLHWMNRIASEGRGKGLRIIMASQRPQKVHKDTLTCAETLIAMRVTHNLDRKAVKEWMDGAGKPDVSAKILAELGEMPRGQAWTWSPEIGYLERDHSPKITTYDSMAAPEGEASDELKGWAGIDLDDVKARLAEVVKEAEANDPKLLRAKISELQRQIAAQEPIVDHQAIANAVASRDREWQKALVEANGSFESLVARLGRIAELATLNGQAPKTIEVPKIESPQTVRAAGPRLAATPAVRRAPRSPAARSAPVLELPDDLKRVHIRCLEAFLWYEILGIGEPTDEQLCYRLGYSPTSSTISVLLSHLRRGGYVDGRRITDAGRSVANAPTIGSMDDFHAQIRSFLDGTARRCFDSMLAAHPRELTAEELCEENGWSTTSSTLSVALSALRRAGLVEKRGHALTNTVFPINLTGA